MRKDRAPREGSPAGRSLPGGLSALLALAALFLSLFLFTAPWEIGGRELSRLTAALGLAAGGVLLGLAVRPRWRRALFARIFEQDFPLRRRTVLLASCLAAIFVFRVLLSRFFALEVNGSDFSVFDWIIERTRSGSFFYSPFRERSFLAEHTSWVLLLFVPLHALAASPYWLLLAQAGSVGAAFGLSFFLFRRLAGDDVSAAMLSVAFLLNSYTAKLAQYVFHVEIFYLPGIFLLLLAFLSRRRGLFALSLVLLICVKEDAVVPLAGFAIAALIFYRRLFWAAAGLGAGLLNFVVSHFLVMPHFAGTAAGEPWYSPFWDRYGASPLAAVLGMVLHPLSVASDLSGSGLRHILEPLLFVPLLGFEWFLAALPAIVIYGVAREEPLSRFTLHYSAAFLPFLFAAVSPGVSRLLRFFKSPASERRKRSRFRVACALVMLMSAFDGASYRLERPKPQRKEIRNLIEQAPSDLAVAVQGSLLPHAGYSHRLVPLGGDWATDGGEAVLLDPSSNPYPFSQRSLGDLIRSLRGDLRYREVRSPGGLLLFLPASREKDSKNPQSSALRPLSGWPLTADRFLPCLVS